MSNLDPTVVTAIQVVMNIALFGLIFYVVYRVYKFVSDKEAMQTMLNDTYRRLSAGKLVDKKEVDKIKIGLEGETDKKTFYERVDEMLIYSGLQVRHSFITPKLVLTWGSVAAFAILLLSLIISRSLLISLVVVAAAVFIAYTVLYVLRIRNYSQEEENLVLFMNMIENFSATSDDIVFIIEKAASFLADPLKGIIQKSVISARVDGDTSKALKKLMKNVEHPMLKRLIYNLELSSRNANDYRDIVKDYRDRINSALVATKRLNAVYANCRNEVFLMLAVGLLVIYMSKDLVDDYGSIIEIFKANVAGMMIGVLVILVYIVSIWFVCFKLRKRK